MLKSATTRTATLCMALGLTLTACGNGPAAKHAAPTATPQQATPSAVSSTDESGLKVLSTNLLMRITSFHASGTTTAFDGGRTEIWSTPGQGLRLQTTTSQAGKSVDIFCKGGTTYTSAPMLAESLKQSGAADITVPPALADVYVTSKTGQGCDSFYKIPEGAKLAPDHDSSVNGTKTFALTAGNGITSGVYHVAAEGKSYLLKLDSSRGGRSSTTTYDSFGEKFAIKFPAADKTMPMSEFRSRVSGH